MKVLVLGGYGAVGGHLVAALRGQGDTVVAAGRDPDRADCVIDLREPQLGLYRAAAADADVVVNAAGWEDPRLAELATAAGAVFVDVTATTEYIDRLERLSAPRPVILSVGLAPGLTNILAAELHRDAPGPIDIAVLLGAGEQHGVAATDWSYRLLGRTFGSGSRLVRNYTEPQVFDLPAYGRRRMYPGGFLRSTHPLPRIRHRCANFLRSGLAPRHSRTGRTHPASGSRACRTWHPSTGFGTMAGGRPGTIRTDPLGSGRQPVPSHRTAGGRCGSPLDDSARRGAPPAPDPSDRRYPRRLCIRIRLHTSIIRRVISSRNARILIRSHVRDPRRCAGRSISP